MGSRLICSLPCSRVPPPSAQTRSSAKTAGSCLTSDQRGPHTVPAAARTLRRSYTSDAYKTVELNRALEQLDAKDWGFGEPGLARVDVIRQPGTWIARTEQGAILCDPRAAFMALRFNLRIAALQVDGFADESSSQSATLQASLGRDATDELGALCQCLRWNVTIRQLELRRMCLAPDGAAVTALRALAQAMLANARPLYWIHFALTHCFLGGDDDIALFVFALQRAWLFASPRALGSCVQLGDGGGVVVGPALARRSSATVCARHSQALPCPSLSRRPLSRRYSDLTCAALVSVAPQRSLAPLCARRFRCASSGCAIPASTTLT